MPQLAARNRILLELALGEYKLEWDEPLERIHPHLWQDKCVSRRQDWLGGGERKGIVGWKAARVLGKASWEARVPRDTRAAFSKASKGIDEELVSAVDLLDRLPGVGVRMATAILMFYDPDRFSVMDVNAWRSLVHIGFADAFDFWYEDAADYPAYNMACRQLSEQFRHNLRDTDRALWILGATAGNPKEYEIQ